MALMDMKSDLSWYGTKPSANNIANTDADGFVTGKPQAAAPSDFKGVSGTPGAMQYSHTGNRQLGILGTTNNFLNTHNEGFTLNIMPKGSGRPDSQFLGISGTEYESTSLYGVLSDGYSPITSREDTKFQGVTEDAPFVEIGGFGNDGSRLAVRSQLAEDAFVHNEGEAKRLSQLGGGSKFPIGPDGQVHGFDKERTGFSTDNKYSDSYGITHGKAGLANTYAAESPIDDMYNKFKVRDQVFDPYGYAKVPFILRGIQQDDKTDPQRWGTPGVFDIPRGGVVTAAERAALDAVRLGKFLIRPPGITFLVKQVGLQLTNPNTEGPDGTAKTNTFMTKLYDPLSSITNAVGGTLGLRTDRHFPPVTRNDLSSYETVKDWRGDAANNTNRLVKIRKQLLEGGSAGPSGILNFFQKVSNLINGRKGETINAISGLTGPGSLLGIGATTIRRADHPSLELNDIDKLAEGRKDSVNKETGATTSIKQQDFRTKEDYKKDAEDTKVVQQIKGKLPTTLNIDPERHGKDFDGGGFNETPVEGIGTTYKTNTYEELKKEPETQGPFDFRTQGEDYVTEVKTSPLEKTYEEKGTGYNKPGEVPKEQTYNDGATPAGKTIVNLIKSQYGKRTSPDEEDGKANFDNPETADVYEKGNDNQSIDDRSGDGTTPQAKDSLKTRAGNIGDEPLDSDKGGILKRAYAQSKEQMPGVEGTDINKGDIKYYKTLTYPNLVRGAAGGHKSFDAGDTYTADETIEQKYKYQSYPLGDRTDAADPIQNLASGTDTSGDTGVDLIKFKFTPLRVDDSMDKVEPIIFRAYINNLTDSFQPSWDENQDQGRADAKIMLSGWSRNISVDFMVALHSKAEIANVWKKLDEFAKLTYPIYPDGGSGFTGTYVNVTIGDLYVNEPMYVTDLSYDWDNETPWNLEAGKQVPYYTNVSMQLGYIGRQRPSYEGAAFTLNAPAS